MGAKKAVAATIAAIILADVVENSLIGPIRDNFACAGAFQPGAEPRRIKLALFLEQWAATLYVEQG